MGKASKRRAKQIRRIAKCLREESDLPHILEAWQIEALARVLWMADVRYKKNP